MQFAIIIIVILTNSVNGDSKDNKSLSSEIFLDKEISFEKLIIFLIRLEGP